MSKQQKFRIVVDFRGFYCVMEVISGIYFKRFIAGPGNTGLELAEEWIEYRREGGEQ